LKKGIRAFMPILVILAMLVSLFSMAVPVAADFDPADSNANSINLDLIRPNLVYNIGDTIYFSVIVETPAAKPVSNFYPGKNTEIVTTFTRPDGVVINFDVIPVQNRGEYVVFDYTTYPGLAYVVNPADADVLGVLRAYAEVDGVSHCSVTGPLPGGNEPCHNDREISTQITIQPCIDIQKTVDCNNDDEFLDEDWGYAGDTGHWKIVVTNCGDAPLHDVVIWDDLGFYQFVGDLDPGQIVEYGYDTVVDEDTTNWAYVEGYDELGGYWYDEDDATNRVIEPCIDIQKTVDCNDDGEFLDEDYGVAGDTGHWKVVVTNCGDAYLFNVDVWDDLYGTLDFITEFAPGDSRTYEYDTTVNEDTTNWAYVEGNDIFGNYWGDEDAATNLVLQPCIDIQKTVDCNDDGEFLDEDYGTPGDTGHWRIVVTNCGEADLFDVYVWDDNGMSWGPFDLPAGDFVQYDYDTIVNETTTNWAYVEGYDVAGGYWYDEDDATNVVTGNEGCTPGYWKNNAINWEAVAWEPTPYEPDERLDCVFVIPSCVNSLAGDTLLKALGYKGGKGVMGAAQILLRSAVAALLNAAHPDINYYMSEGGVIAAVNAALATCDRATMLLLYTELDLHNNDGCVLDMHGYPIIPIV